MVVSHKPQIKIACRPLSTLVPDATVVEVDIEGHEYAVIEEALPRLKHAHSWAVELHMVPGRPLQRVLSASMAEGFRVLTPVRRPNESDGPWGSEEISPTLDWTAIPVTKVRGDCSVFKMLHVIATRTANPR